MRFSSLLIPLLFSFASNANAQTVTLNINRGSQTPVAPGFSGFNVVSSNSPANFNDPKFQQMVRALNPGVLRWPGGTVDDAFNWKTGMVQAPSTDDGSPWTMIDILRAHFLQFPEVNFNKQIQSFIDGVSPMLVAKGGNPLGDNSSGFGGFAANSGGARLMIVVNSISDTVESAKELAYYVSSRGMPVVAFELSNEPFYVMATSDAVGPLPGSLHRGKMPPAPGVFTDGYDYLTKMKPYYDAIKKGCLSAGVVGGRCVVAIAGGYATETNKWNTLWAGDLDRYAKANGAYWDAVAMHFYPKKSTTGDFNDSILFANDALQNGTDKYAATLAGTSWGAGKRLVVSEYCPTFDDQTMNGSVYGGIFAAEYISRMSEIPATINVAMHELTNQIDGIGAPPNAIGGSGNWGTDMKKAGKAGQRIDSTGRLTGMYTNAQALSVSLANAAVNYADFVYKTSLSGSLGNVKTHASSLPALHASAYHRTDGKTEILIINKGASDMTINVQYEGQNSPGTFSMQTVTGNPSDRNTASSQPITIQNTQVKNPITIPKYGVVHLEQ